MARKPLTPHAGAVNAAHAANSQSESFQDNHPDQVLIEAWVRRQAAYEVYNALPFNEDIGGNVGDLSPAESEQWKIIDATELAIRSAVATTPRGIILQLLVSLSHSLTDRTEVEAVNSADLPTLYAMDEGFDWTDRMIVAAIRSLEAMEPINAAPNFDMADWLARFEAVGGYITPNGCGWYIYDRTEEERTAARAIYGEIEADPARGRALKAFSNTPEQLSRYLRSIEGEA